MRIPKPFKNDCEEQKHKQQKQKQKKHQLQLQHQREMINSGGREGNVWVSSYGPDWREPPWVVHLLPGPSAPRPVGMLVLGGAARLSGLLRAAASKASCGAGG